MLLQRCSYVLGIWLPDHIKQGEWSATNMHCTHAKMWGQSGSGQGNIGATEEAGDKAVGAAQGERA